MLNAAGLSLDQAPPIETLFSFFLLAPLFAIAAGGMLVWQGDLILLSRWTPQALAVTHLVALGFLTQVMCGALLQMLPVLAGAPVPGVVALGRLTQVALVVGCAALSWGLYSGQRVALMAGGTALLVGLAIFALVIGIALRRARGVPQTVVAMRLAVVALVVTALLGTLLLAALLGAEVAGFHGWVELHLGWGLLGWAGMLIMGVGYQVVPMFHVTPAYPAWLTRTAAPSVAAGLILATLLMLMGQPAAIWALGLSIAACVLFAMVTLNRQFRRERPRIDATLLYWWVSMSLMIAAALVWVLDGRDELIGVMVLIGIGVGLPTGMLLKIMPFLSWFHLQHRQVTAKRFDLRLPHMGTFIPERLARVQFGLFVMMLALLILAVLFPATQWGRGLARAGGVALILSCAVLWWLQIQCYLRYRRFSRTLG